MNKVYRCVTALFFSVGLPWYGWVIYQDLCHPEIWDQDVLHDPRISLPLLAILLPLCVVVYRRELSRLYRSELEFAGRKRRQEQQLQSLLEQLAAAQRARPGEGGTEP